MLGAMCHRADQLCSGVGSYAAHRDGMTDRRLTARRSVLQLAGLGTATALWVSGCSVILPSVPFSPAYVVNRGGHFFAGSRCSDNLIQVEVFLRNSPPATMTTPLPLPDASWRAVADSPDVPEFELYGGDQPKVTVTADDGTRPHSVQILVTVHEAKGYSSSVLTVLDTLSEGQVASASGMTSWDKFMNRPKRDFGC